MTDAPSRLRSRGHLLVLGVLLLGLPIALMGVFADPNEYQAALGISAVDCDGPLGVYLFAVPAFALYAAGFVFNALRRTPTSLAVAIICFGICAALAANLVRAVDTAREQSNACASR